MAYQPRLIDAKVAELLKGLPAVALEGAKGVGKTSTAEQSAAATIRLDRAAERAVLVADRERINRGPHPLLIDEWQRDPEIWDTVRRSVDSDVSPGRFILTGSANVRDAQVRSGAGRIVRLRMRPLAWSERDGAEPAVSLSALLAEPDRQVSGETNTRVHDYVNEILWSGFPGIRAFSERFRAEALHGYLDNAVMHDIQMLGTVPRRPDTLRRWFRAYAAASSTTASFEAIADAVGGEARPNRTTITGYRDLLTQLWLLDEVPAWDPGGVSLKRLGRSPKHQLADPALAASLLGVTSESLIGARSAADTDATLRSFRDGPFLGRLFESLVTLSVRAYAEPLGFQIGHLRTRGGDHEIDVILHAPDGRVVAIEVKLAEAVDERDVRHLHWLQAHLGDRVVDRIVVTTGPSAYRRSDGVAVVPLALLGP